jgi:hydrogenase maturation protein HypF
MKYDLAYSMVSEAIEALVGIAAKKALQEEISNIGITGGVAYNLPIVRMVKDAVEKKGLTFVTHHRVPSGDGGISVGQNAIVGNILEERG